MRFFIFVLLRILLNRSAVVIPIIYSNCFINWIVKKSPVKKDNDLSFDQSDLPDFSTPKSLAVFIKNSWNILGSVVISESLNNLSFTAKKYDQQKIRAINRFHAIIVHYPSLSKLAEFALDLKQKDGQRISCFILLTRGVKHSSNNRIINTYLIFFVQNLRTKVSEGNGLDWSVFWIDELLFTVEHVKSRYQPSVTSLFNRHLFKYFHDEGILFSQRNDLNFTWDFQAYWAELSSLAK